MQSAKKKQIKVYFGKCMRMFVNEKGWKVFISSAIITLLICLVTGSEMFKEYYATKNGAFALVCACIWIGIFNSIQSVCKERSIIKREHRSGMYIFSYVNAHALFELIQSMAEAIIVIIITTAFNHANMPSMGVFMPLVLELTMTFFIIIYSSDLLGLMISCIVKTPQTAMTIMPFVLILQLIMSGMIFELSGFTEGLSYLMISKYGMDAICISTNVQSMTPSYIAHNSEYDYNFLNLLKMWLLPLVFAVVYDAAGMLCLSFVDKDKR